MRFLDNKIKDFERLSKDEYMEKYNLDKNSYDEAVVEYAKDKIAEMFYKDEDYSNLQVSFILQDNLDSKDILALVLTNDGGDGRMVNIFDDLKSFNAFDWDFSFDSYVFYYLENGYDIKYMDELTHNAICKDLKYYFPHSINNVEGAKIYMDYCIKNDINSKDMQNLKIKEQEYYNDFKDFENNVMDFKEKDSPSRNNQEYPKKYTKKDLLQEFKAIIVHNIDCYSEGHFISKPRKGFEKEWNLEHARLKLIDEIIKDENKLVIAPKEMKDRCL